MDDAPRSKVTLRDLADSLGVSKTTVSNAFSRPDQLSPELRDRILDAAREAGYAGPDAVARMLRTGRAGAVGLILPESLPFSLDDPAASELIRGIADACEERRLGLLIVPGALNAADPRAITGVAVDGFIAYSMPRGAVGLEAALGRGLPLVVVDQPRLPGVTTVSIDDRGGARAVARHLIGLGHRRFAAITLPFRADGYTGPARAGRIEERTLDIAAERLFGYREALAEAGVAPDEMPVYECARSMAELGEQAAAHLLDAPVPPTAILAMSDRLALGAMAAAMAGGLRIPEDLSVAGFGDIPAAAHARPSLTTVSQPLRLKGYAAARLLLDGAPRGGGVTGGGSVTGGGATDEALDLPVELVVRRSTGPVPITPAS